MHLTMFNFFYSDIGVGETSTQLLQKIVTLLSDGLEKHCDRQN